MTETLTVLSVGVKGCGKCKKIKAFGAFPRQAGKAGGLHSYCRDCNRERALVVRADGKHVEYRVRYKNRHPDRYRADRILWGFRNRGDCPTDLTRERIINDMYAGLSCPYCKSPLGVENLSYDHKNGRGSEIHPVCIECNLFKNIMHHDDFVKVVAAIGIDRLRFYRENVRRAWSRR